MATQEPKKAAQTCFKEAKQLQQNGQLKAAVEKYQEALSLDRSQPDIYKRLGDTLKQQGK